MAEAETVRAASRSRVAANSWSWLQAGLRYISDAMLPVSVGLWALGVSRTHASALGQFGLPAALPVVFYAGLALLVISIGRELARSEISHWRLALHAAALVVMLYGTAPLVYPAGRYAWLYKTIGVVQYVNVHGKLNHLIDIYQNWPGFFAFTAWFDKVAGVSSPLGYAKWSQPVAELCALPLLYLCYRALALSERQRWTALLLYAASNWIGQDYLSPQALGTLLSLGIMALTLQWLYVPDRPRSPRGRGGRWRRLWRRAFPRLARALGLPAGDSPAGAGSRQAQVPATEARASRASPARDIHRLPVSAIVLLAFFVLTFTHELSPYLLVLQIGLLAVLRQVPRWLPIGMAAIAIGYLIPRYGYVSSHYGLLKSIGAFFSNAAPPSFYTGPQPLSQRMIQYSADLLSVVIWSLALVGAWLRRRSRRAVLTLLVLAFSPFCVLGLVAYGNEGLLRVYLFSLPWAAALAAAVLAPERQPDGRAASGHGAPRRRATLLRRSGRILSPLRAPLTLAIAAALFMPAFFGDDYFNAMPAGQVAAVTAFLTQAQPGPIFAPVTNAAPLADTERYNQFPQTAIFGQYGMLGTAAVTPSIAALIAARADALTGGQRPAYVVVTPEMLAYIRAYGLASPSGVSTLLASLAKSGRWRQIPLHQSGLLIYERPPVAKVPG